MSTHRRRLRRWYIRVSNGRFGRALGDRLGMRRRAFQTAYRLGMWTKSGESLSGDGSTLEATERLREALPDALRELNVSTFLDVPCGDWNWMSSVELPIDRYIGGDLLPSLVETNQSRFGDAEHEFRVIDLCRDDLPAADFLLCRDALVHFSEADVWRAADEDREGRHLLRRTDHVSRNQAERGHSDGHRVEAPEPGGASVRAAAAAVDAPGGVQPAGSGARRVAGRVAAGDARRTRRSTRSRVTGH